MERDGVEADPLAVVGAFNAAWTEHDLERCVAMLTEDCLFDGTGPAPDGTPYVGRDAVRDAWRAIFDDPASTFDVEDVFAAGADRVVQRWRYDWGDGHVRGIDVFVVRDGRIAEKRSYVKG